MYLNTGLLMMFSDWDIPVWPLTYFVGSRNVFKDTAKNWYIESGNSILVLIILNLVGY